MTKKTQATHRKAKDEAATARANTMKVAAMDRLVYQLQELSEEGVVTKQIKLVVKDDEMTDWLVVITADTESSAIIAFHGASSILEALTGLGARLKNKTLRWKTDDYANRSE